MTSRYCVWDVSLSGDGTRTFATTMARALDADVVRFRGRCDSPTQLARFFDRYELVLMSSAKWHDMERWTVDDAWHVRVARRLPGKLVPTLHNTLDESQPDAWRSPHVRELLRTCQRAWTNDRTNVADAAHNELVEDRRLPFDATGYAANVTTYDVEVDAVLSTCRLTLQKDIYAPLRVGYRGPYVVAGRAAFTQARRLRDIAIRTYGAEPVAAYDPDRSWQQPWGVRFPGAGYVAYVGPYGTRAVPSPPWYLASTHFAGTYDRHLEYVTLEALTAGLVCVVPEHAVAELGYRSRALVTYRDDTDLLAALDDARSRRLTADDVAVTWRDLVEHDPARLAGRLTGGIR